MTPDGFRKIALSMPEAIESGHMGHPDFRVKGKIFATLIRRNDIDWGVLNLTPAQQRVWMDRAPTAFELVPGGWGRKGYTQVRLRSIKTAILKEAMFVAWLNTAPRNLLDRQPPGRGR